MHVQHDETVELPWGVFSAADAKTTRGRIDKVPLWLKSIAPDLLQSYEAATSYSIETRLARSERLTHSTGSAPRGNKALLQSWGHSTTLVHRATEVGLSLGPTLYKKFTLVAVPRDSGSGESNQADGVQLPFETCEVAAWDLASEQSSSTVNTADFDARSTINFEEFLDNSFVKAERPILKNDRMFGEYAREHFSHFLDDVLHPLLQTLPLESILASAFNGDSESAHQSDALKRGYKMLIILAFELFNAQSLDLFFSHELSTSGRSRRRSSSLR